MSSRALFVLAGLSGLGCHLVLGDFEFVEPEPVVVSLGLACEPHEVRCSGANLEACAPDRRGFALVQSCPSEAECSLNAESCRPCRPGEHQCRGELLERCDGGAWVPAQTCATAGLCRLAADRLSGSCAEPACALGGQHQCSGARLLRCSANRERLELVGLCESAELCDAAAADLAFQRDGRSACLAAACAAGSLRCTDATLEYCTPAQTGFSPLMVCPDAASCSASRGACEPCTAGEVECNGPELRRCTEGQGWQTLEVCSASGRCNADAERCEAPECDEPGLLRCTRGLPVLEECSPERVWRRKEACASSALCNAEAGRCLPAACALDETRCRGNVHQRCANDLSRFETLRTCGAGQVCDAELGCLARPCSDDESRCNGAVFERCAGGTFQPELVCETEALCDADAGCSQGICGGSLQDFDCRGSIIYQCTPGHEAWVEFRTCADGTFCDSQPALTTGLPECDACEPGLLSCDGLELRRCSSDGQAEELVASCPSVCSVAAGVVDCR